MTTPINIQFPTGVDEKNRAYLEIKMKTLEQTKADIKNINLLMGDYKEKLKKASVSILDVLGSDSETINGLIDDNIVDKKSGKDEITKNQLKGTDKLIFNTYIPADFGVSLSGNWEATELISQSKMLETLVTGGSKLLGDAVGGFIASQYTVLKNQLQYHSNMTLSPLEIKQFKPSFLDTTLNFDFVPKNKEESTNILKAMMMLKQGLIPSSTNGEWFTFPALFDVNVIIREKDDNGVEIINNDGNGKMDLFTNFKNLGMTSFSLTSNSGNNLDMKFREDGTLPAYKLSMGFTTVEKYYANDSEMSVSKRIDDIEKRYS
jgi:hypothetical protein